MLDGLVWALQNLVLAFFNFANALINWDQWMSWTGGMETPEDKQALMRFIYYGGSTEFFFVVFTLFLVIFLVGLWSRKFLWGVVIALEGFANGIGRFFAWAGILMVIQQILIVFNQRIFATPEISLGFGSVLTRDISWWAEELKLYNAMIVALCVTYTFVQGGHVRVDLIYSAISFRAKRLVDMVGCMIFMIPAAVLTWMYGWYFLWRHLVVPKPSASDTLDRLIAKARALRWNVETIGFSPNGFDAYFLFKVLLVAYAGLVFIHGWAFFYRSYLEWREGPESEHKYLDRDVLGSDEAELVHAIEEHH
ncbi:MULTISPECIES: TRAP transporter small permease subunit [Marinovum]|mgnify:FL=1|jgi:TRAP-type mannitol/chloroaromatic compound transport system permease small subunit|uniref:TRAP transporter small permease subunit n=1 Tax=Marinovum TaxID=367771 RepID=UPI00237C4E18|nr:MULTISPECIES: TRAP transporter small permease subunit [Marinovum]MDD9742431.1 TRAP transporter small permease subunit [Marinovum sp. PR37]